MPIGVLAQRSGMTSSSAPRFYADTRGCCNRPSLTRSRVIATQRRPDRSRESEHRRGPRRRHTDCNGPLPTLNAHTRNTCCDGGPGRAGAGQPSVALPATITGQNLEVWFERPRSIPPSAHREDCHRQRRLLPRRRLHPGTPRTATPTDHPIHPAAQRESRALTANSPNTMNAGSTSPVSAFDTPLPTLRSTYGRLSQPTGPPGWGNSSRDCCPVDVHAEISDPVHPAHELSNGQMKWGTGVSRGACSSRRRTRRHDHAPARAHW